LEARSQAHLELSSANEEILQRHAEATILYKVSSVIKSMHMEELLTEVLNTIQIGLFSADKGGIFIVKATG
jgi:hypothetical protein